MFTQIYRINSFVTYKFYLYFLKRLNLVFKFSILLLKQHYIKKFFLIIRNHESVNINESYNSIYLIFTYD